MEHPPIAILAEDAPPRLKQSGYPAPFLPRVAGRMKKPLGDMFGIRNFGVNLTTLEPGAESAMLHRHKTQDEFIFILAGRPTLVTDRGEVVLAPGMCAGFPARGIAHHLVNRSGETVTYLEVGDRSPGDMAEYPCDDLEANLSPAGQWVFTRKGGQPY
jgi:uncharacterized cupin superfamily protein